MGIFDRFKFGGSSGEAVRVPSSKNGAIFPVEIPDTTSYAEFDCRLGDLDLPAINSIVNNKGEYPTYVLRMALEELRLRAKTDEEAAIIVEREWKRAEEQARPLRFDADEWAWVRSLGGNPADGIQSAYINRVINDSPTVHVSGVNGTDVVMSLPGAKELPLVSREQGRAFRITGLSRFRRNSYFDICTGFPLVCAKCGRPMTRLSPLFGIRLLESGGHLRGLVLRGDNAKEIMYLLERKRVLIALPSCGDCDSEASIYYGYQYMKPRKGMLWEEYFYTDDPRMAATLKANGCSVREVVIHEGRESPPSSPTILSSTISSPTSRPPEQAKDFVRADASRPSAPESAVDQSEPDATVEDAQELIIPEGSVLEREDHVALAAGGQAVIDRLLLECKDPQYRTINPRWNQMGKKQTKEFISRVTDEAILERIVLHPDIAKKHETLGIVLKEEAVSAITDDDILYNIAKSYTTHYSTGRPDMSAAKRIGDPKRVAEALSEKEPWVRALFLTDETIFAKAGTVLEETELAGFVVNGIEELRSLDREKRPDRPVYFKDADAVAAFRHFRSVSALESVLSETEDEVIRNGVTEALKSLHCKQCGAILPISGRSPDAPPDPVACICANCNTANHQFVEKSTSSRANSTTEVTIEWDECRRCGLVENKRENVHFSDW